MLPSQNVGELLTRLPGISFTTDDDNLINNVAISDREPTQQTEAVSRELMAAAARYKKKF